MKSDNNYPSKANFFQFGQLYWITIFFSLTSSDFKKILDFKAGSLQSYRLCILILIHVNKFPKVIKMDLKRFYTLKYETMTIYIEKLLLKGYIKETEIARKTNIDAYVKQTAYLITPIGLEAIARFNNHLLNVVGKISPKNLI